MSGKVAVIGVGRWGKNVLRAMCENVGPENVVVVDEAPALLDAARQRHPGIGTYASAAELWGNDEVTAVAVATPPFTHEAIASAALRAGKHVFVEKPLAANTAEAEALCRLADECGRVLMVDHLLLYHPAVEELERRVNDGELGELSYIYSQRLNLGVIRQEENVLWSLGAHDIAVTIELFGKAPTSVSAQGGVYVQPERGIHDVAFVNLLFENGQRAHLHLSWLDPGKVRKITVVGSRKMAVFDDMEPTWKIAIHDKGGILAPEDHSPQARYGDITVPTVPLDEPLKRACAHFLECAASGAKPRTDGWSGLNVVRVLEAAQTSMEHDGASVPVLAGRA